MKTINLSPEELKGNNVEFNNNHLPDEESFIIELGFSDNTGRFLLWQNGELIAMFQTFRGLMGRALPIIDLNHLEKVA